MTLHLMARKQMLLTSGFIFVFVFDIVIFMFGNGNEMAIIV
jgi:hypothetical protein